MMRTFVIFYITLTAVFISNGQTSTVFPLHVGDQWLFFNYVDESYSWSKIVKDTVMPNGIQYAVMARGYSLPTYYRYSLDSVFQYGFGEQQQEELIFRFSGSVGDTINKIVFGNDTLSITLIEKINTTVFGASRWTWTFFFDIASRWDDEVTYTIVDSIGITKKFSYGYEGEVQGALINGVVFGSITSVKNNLIQPTQFLLKQNFPNPFNPSTRIDFVLPYSSFTILRVFDILGKEVAILVAEELSGGNHSKVWDASKYCSGVYYYTLRSDKFSETKKMILTK